MSPLYVVFKENAHHVLLEETSTRRYKYSIFSRCHICGQRVRETEMDREIDTERDKYIFIIHREKKIQKQIDQILIAITSGL